MNIVIIPPDNRMSVGAVTKTVELGHLPQINCARLQNGRGSVEHCEYEGDWPPPLAMKEEDFLERFAKEIGAFHQAETDEEVHAREHAARQAAAREQNAYVPTKDDYIVYVDLAAEGARGKLVTPGSGMAAVYQEKAAEAVAVIAMGREATEALADAGAHDFPLLAASVGIDAASLYDVAEIVSDKAEAFATAAGAIERVRLLAKQAIRTAGSDGEAKAIYEAVQWP